MLSMPLCGATLSITRQRPDQSISIPRLHIAAACADLVDLET